MKADEKWAEEMGDKIADLLKQAERLGMLRAANVARRYAENTTDPRQASVANAIADEIEGLREDA